MKKIIFFSVIIFGGLYIFLSISYKWISADIAGEYVKTEGQQIKTSEK